PPDPAPCLAASVAPQRFGARWRPTRGAEAARGEGGNRARPAEITARRGARKSLVAARALRTGEPLAAADVTSKRPGTGISPAELPRVLGLRLTRDVAADEVISWEALARS